jgi:hypothetical protein
VYFVLGDQWKGFFPVFGDETFYYAHMQTIAEGHYNDGNPYFFEHQNGPPLVIFAGAWISALPLLLGLSFNLAIFVNFILWSLLFATVAYLLYRELSVSPWLSVSGVVLLYLQSYQHIFRPANLQPVYPFYFLFYLALARFLREQSKKNIVLLALVSASTCYLYSYLWQVVAVTLGLLILYAFARQDWILGKASVSAALLGGFLGFPAVLYTFWLSHTSPYFWESIARFGLVYTHIPMAEIFYSGGWIGLVLIFLVVLYWSTPTLRTQEFRFVCLFISVTGLGLWVTQGSNAFTGLLLETGEHIKVLILPWLLFVSPMLGSYLWRYRSSLILPIRIFSVATIGGLVLLSAYYTYARFVPFVTITESRRTLWVAQQHYVKTFEWLQSNEKDPMVIWSDPQVSINTNLSTFTRHYTLFTTAGMWHLVPQEELLERYLVSQYFNKPTKEDLKRDMAVYLGRQDVFHIAKTLEREIKVCRLLALVIGDKNCGTIQNSTEVLGEAFFDTLEQKFKEDIQPNIFFYIKKYHVSYLLRDMSLNPHWNPELLNAKRVYADDSYELYRLPL